MPTDADVPDCESCGACCAYSWEWPTFIGDWDGDGIMEHLKEDGRMRCNGNRCAALMGTLGESVFCSVYEHRPLVCREFTAGSDACHTVRSQLGLQD
ncbi:YkgJ family cysteine cluster protein [Azospirillum brasilense]|uniref:YkgJ family cysteine cluster protein n=1 Tax=Azospirillum brasilense TaxID=192 RepID=UPI000E0BA4E1|nr:YkgJ family cysteine cluster protein [Azospirillum brasilense]